jgi:hypothetical protein
VKSSVPKTTAIIAKITGQAMNMKVPFYFEMRGQAKTCDGLKPTPGVPFAASRD